MPGWRHYLRDCCRWHPHRIIHRVRNATREWYWYRERWYTGKHGRRSREWGRCTGKHSWYYTSRYRRQRSRDTRHHGKTLFSNNLLIVVNFILNMLTTNTMLSPAAYTGMSQIYIAIVAIKLRHKMLTNEGILNRKREPYMDIRNYF